MITDERLAAKIYNKGKTGTPLEKGHLLLRPEEALYCDYRKDLNLTDKEKLNYNSPNIIMIRKIRLLAPSARILLWSLVIETVTTGTSPTSLDAQVPARGMAEQRRRDSVVMFFGRVSGLHGSRFGRRPKNIFFVDFLIIF